MVLVNAPLPPRAVRSPAQASAVVWMPVISESMPGTSSPSAVATALACAMAIGEFRDPMRSLRPPVSRSRYASATLPRVGAACAPDTGTRSPGDPSWPGCVTIFPPAFSGAGAGAWR
jgi:hypothetical protein